MYKQKLDKYLAQMEETSTRKLFAALMFTFPTLLADIQRLN